MYGAASFIPFALLCTARALVMHEMATKPVLSDYLNVQQGEIEFWSIWAFAWAFAARLPVRFWAGGVRALFHVCNAVLLGASVAEIGFFEVTGGRADLDTVAFGLGDFARVWPVVASELKPVDYGVTIAVLLTSFAPLVWRPKSNGRGWIGALSLLALVPTLQMEMFGRQKPSKAMKALQRTFVEALYFEAIARIGDSTEPPPPGELEPLRISPPTHPYNVVLIFLESVGAKRTTLYQPELMTTPALMERGAQGLVASNMYAAVPHTSKALVTTLCGNYPDLTGDAREARPGGQPGRCLPGILNEQGYRTAFFQTAREDFEDRVDMVHQMGFTTFRSKDTLSGASFEKNNYFGIDDRAMLAPGVDWSKADSSTPFFATYLTLASHHDYKLPTHWQLLDFPKVTGRLEQYYNAVRYVDDFVDRLVRGYEEAGLAENTLFIVQGDHGEGFGEHGRYQHDLTIYEEGLQIPFVMWGAKALQGRTGKIEGLRQQIDILPTIVDVLGSQIIAGHTPGISMLTEPDPDRVLYHSCWRAHRCLARREHDRVFLYHYGDIAPQLFDFVKDFAERKDVVKKLKKGESERLSEEVRTWWGRVRGRFEARREYYLQTIQRPDDTHAFASWGGGSLSLLGCEVEPGPLIPGDQAWVTCAWRPERHLNESWTMAPQLKIGSRTTKSEWTPFMGVHKMWTWRPGWRIEETFRVKIPLYSKEGIAKISVGWTRIGGLVVKTDSGKERVDVATVQIAKRPALATAGHEGIELSPREPWPESFSLPDLAKEGDEPAPKAAEGTLDDEPPVEDDRGVKDPEAQEVDEAGGK